MILDKSSKLFKIGQNLLTTGLNEDFKEAQELIDELKNNEAISELDKTTKIEWGNDKIFDGKTPEEIAYIKDCREFIQKMFSEYQLNTIAVLAETQKKFENTEFKDDEEKNQVLQSDMQNKAMSMLIALMIKCVNWANKKTNDIANEQYHSYVDEVEDIYFDIKAKNNALENENRDLKDEIERLKNKKFLGIFKIH